MIFMSKGTRGYVFTLQEMQSFSWAATFDLWPHKSVRGQSSRLGDDGDYTIKILVNLLARNKSKCPER